MCVCGLYFDSEGHLIVVQVHKCATPNDSTKREKEREREREGEGDRQEGRGRERERERKDPTCGWHIDSVFVLLLKGEREIKWEE